MFSWLSNVPNWVWFIAAIVVIAVIFYGASIYIEVGANEAQG